MHLAESGSTYVCGLVVRFRLLPTPSLDDAVAFRYGPPVFRPEEDFHLSDFARSQAHQERRPGGELLLHRGHPFANRPLLASRRNPRIQMKTPLHRPPCPCYTGSRKRCALHPKRRNLSFITPTGMICRLAESLSGASAQRQFNSAKNKNHETDIKDRGCHCTFSGRNLGVCRSSIIGGHRILATPRESRQGSRYRRRAD